ncbi:MBL fold metallo-hydrolase [Hyphomonas oceanitis]|uniref:MBL fold metallo-hydrolase n=1 Tax=Hyphomonas oceanitis TaxID=81033 RepID=UPI00300168E6
MKWFLRITAGLAGLLLIAFIGFQVFKTQIAMAAFKQAVGENVGRDASKTLPDGLHVFVCGAGTPMPDPMRAGPCLAVLAGKRAFVFDAGSGGSRNLNRMGFPLGKTERVYLTHLHSDHMDGLGELLMQVWVNGGRDEPLPVSGPRGVDEVVDGFNGAYRIDGTFRTAHHGLDVANPAGRGGVGETITLPAGPGSQAVVLDEDGLKITAFAVSHAPVEPAFGYRIDYKGRSVAFSGDTIYSPNLVGASKGVDVLFHEALDPEMVGIMHEAAVANDVQGIPQILDDILTYHATPSDAARSATEAGARQLVFYHTIPPLPSHLLNALFVRDAKNIFKGKITVSEDGMVFSLPVDSDAITQHDGFK